MGDVEDGLMIMLRSEAKKYLKDDAIGAGLYLKGTTYLVGT
jgi:hypothetical protein